MTFNIETFCSGSGSKTPPKQPKQTKRKSNPRKSTPATDQLNLQLTQNLADNIISMCPTPIKAKQVLFNFYGFSLDDTIKLVSGKDIHTLEFIQFVYEKIRNTIRMIPEEDYSEWHSLLQLYLNEYSTDYEKLNSHSTL